MALEFVCPHCDKLLRTADDKAGARASCPHCRGPIEIPDLADDDGASEAGSHDDPLGDFFGAPAGRPAATRSEPATARCPACQFQVPAGARTCHHCGATVPASAPAQRFSAAPPLRPHRGALILTFAILGWLFFGCVPLSFSAALMGTNDLQEMRAGRMDPAGESMTQVGQVMGYIQLGLFALSIVGIVIIALIG